MSYSIEEIKQAWSDYCKKRVVRINKGGTVILMPLPKSGIGNIGAVNAEIVKINRIVGFPRFLERYYGK